MRPFRLMSPWISSLSVALALLAGCKNNPAPQPGTSTQPVEVESAAPAVDREAQARAVLDSLTLEQKAGQLFIAWMRADANQDTLASMKALLEAGTLGGVILSKGSSGEAAVAVDYLADVEGVPPWFAGDFEAGLAFRFPDATDFGNQMLIGATDDTRLAYEAGRITSVEGHALGITWNFAPVVDVNSNPRNPIINVRAFGGDPDQVGRFGLAMSRGIQDHGMLACIKHFPGHGNVASDSHLEMPTVRGSRRRLERVELAPFQVAFDAGENVAGSVMCGHLAVPGLGEEEGVPATLSHRILTEVLRDEMGFKGLMATDALDMGGVAGGRTPEQVAVEALAAGADVLLMPPKPARCRDAVVAAVRAGEVSTERLDDACYRVLLVKARYGVLDGLRPRADWQDVIGCEAHQAVAREIAAKGLTAVRVAEGALPLPGGEPVLLVYIQDKAGSRHEELAAGLRAAGQEVEEVAVDPKTHPEQIQGAIDRIERHSGPVVAALFAKVRSYSGSIGLPEEVAPVFAAAAGHERCVAVSFGNPYLILDQRKLPTYLCAFADTPHTNSAVAAALVGDASIRGRLPVDIPGVASMGTGRLVAARPMGAWSGETQDVAAPARGRFVPGRLPAAVVEELSSVLQRAVGDKVFPGAVLAITRGGEPVLEMAVGTHTYEDGAREMAVEDPFDLASLSKVCATTPVALQLIEQGRLSLTDKVADFVPAFTGDRKDEITIEHLLTHTGGLAAHKPFWNSAEGYGAVLQAVAETPMDRTDAGEVVEPGTRYRYSDLGMILLMACLERAGGKGFDQLAQALVFDRLGMTGAGYVLTEEPALDAVPTELDPERGGVMKGRVHDENAFAMGGVSGHAGLFGTADDVLRAGHLFLGDGLDLLDSRTTRMATHRAGPLRSTSTRGLGWDTAKSGWWGSNPPYEVFGHTGFTGTSLWCDPVTGTAVVLLTNRVHPTRENSRITPVRRAVHDIVQDWLGR